MSSNDPYLEAARAYADGVRVLFAPAGVPTGERGERGPASYEDLVGQAEQLAPQSAQLTEAATVLLEEKDAALRVQASTRLLAKVLTDLDISLYLLQAAMDEEDEIAWAEEAEGERSRSGFSLEGQLAFLLGDMESDLGAAERGTTAAADVPSAHSELSDVIEDTLALISEQAGKTAQTAFTGLLGIGIAQVAEAAGLVGLEIAQVLGQTEAVTRLYGLVRDFALQAYNSLLALLGPRLAELVGQQVLEWLESLEEGEKIGHILEKLYETERTGRELDALVRDSQAELERLVAAIADVDSLEATYRQQIQLADKLLPKLKYLRLIPAAALPAGRLLLAAIYIALGGYVVLAGADFVDAQRLQKLDRVPGVRRVVETHLVQVVHPELTETEEE
jgi:hypothetical protein